MRLNKNGSSLVELIISIALISVVMAFLMKLLVDVNNKDNNSTYAKDNQVLRAQLIRTIENDLNGKMISNVSYDDDDSTITITLKDGSSSTITVDKTNKTITYKTLEKKSKKYTLKDGTIGKCSASFKTMYDYINSYNINIEIYTVNEHNQEGNNNVIDDITISGIVKTGFLAPEVTTYSISVNEKNELTFTGIVVLANETKAEITKIYFSIDGGQTYVEKLVSELSTNTEGKYMYTWDTALTAGIYTTAIKVEDTNGKQSEWTTFMGGDIEIS